MSAKPSIILLHGATGSSADLNTIALQLKQDYHVYVPDFPGHGGETLLQRDFSISSFADYIKQYLGEKGLLRPIVFGYSMGGYVALYLERQHPGTFSHIITLGTKFLWNEEISARECGRLNPVVITEKVPAFATALRAMHGADNWQEMLRLTANMITAMGHDSPLKDNDFAAINAPVLLMLGDRDKMVTLDETMKASKQLSNARVCILPDTPHAIGGIDSVLVAQMISGSGA